jgi:hypothetical protein
METTTTQDTAPGANGFDVLDGEGTADPRATRTTTPAFDRELDEVEELARHRGLVREALRVYAKACETTKKHELTIGNTTDQTDDKIRTVESLIELLADQRELALNGTPIGAVLAADAKAKAALDDALDTTAKAHAKERSGAKRAAKKGTAKKRGRFGQLDRPRE